MCLCALLKYTQPTPQPSHAMHMHFKMAWWVFAIGEANLLACSYAHIASGDINLEYFELT